MFSKKKEKFYFVTDHLFRYHTKLQILYRKSLLKRFCLQIDYMENKENITDIISCLSDYMINDCFIMDSLNLVAIQK